MNYQHVTNQRQLVELCGQLAGRPWIAFDTEFVSEDTYRPNLCLVQVAADGVLAVIDTKSVDDAQPFWESLAQGEHVTIAHAGREELRFCLQSVGRRPSQLVDVQIAAGLVGLEYPASYGTLVDKLLGKSLHKGETRTDWRRRPLSERQLEYALQDVEFLFPIFETLTGRLSALDRSSWLDDEMNDWQQQVEDAENNDRWRRISGITSLKPRQLAIARELWKWREAQAEQRNRPPKRILRDDLIVEIARRETADVKRISAVRGMERGDLRRHHEAFAECVGRALSLPKSELPSRGRRNSTPQRNLLSQFLSTALGSICRTANVAPSIVGTAQDVRELIEYRLGDNEAGTGDVPALARGWRAEVVGRVIEDLLAGELSIRITQPNSVQPLSFERR